MFRLIYVGVLYIYMINFVQNLDVICDGEMGKTLKSLEYSTRNCASLLSWKHEDQIIVEVSYGDDFNYN